LTPQEFCPFAVPAPQFHFVDKPLFAEGESKVWNIAKLKDRLLVIANLYLTCSHGMGSGAWYEQRTAYATREANLSDFIQAFQAVSDSDRLLSILLARYGSDLCFNLLNRLIAELVNQSGGIITIADAEKMTLGEVVERLEKPSLHRRVGNVTETAARKRGALLNGHHRVVLAVQRGLLRITGNSGAAILTSLSHLPRKPSLHLHTRAVLLGAPGERPIVDGIEKSALTLPQYDVVKALLEAGKRGLSKDELDRKSKHGDARKILKRLAESDPDWKAVIYFPGKTGGGYRIA
jgi:hypothetical protein